MAKAGAKSGIVVSRMTIHETQMIRFVAETIHGTSVSRFVRKVVVAVAQKQFDDRLAKSGSAK